MKKVFIFLISGLVFLIGGGIAFAATAENEPQNIDVYSHVYDNGDGTYSLYIETDTNFGKSELFDPYVPPADDHRYPTLEAIAESDYVDILSSEIITPVDSVTYPVPETSIVEENGLEVVKWTLDAGMPYVDVEGSMFPQTARNTLKVDFKLKDGYYGNISPFSSINYSGQYEGNNAIEDYTMDVWLSSILVEEPENLGIETGFFDEVNGSEITDEIAMGSDVYVRYVLTNPNSFAVDNVIFSQDGELSDISVEGGLQVASLSVGEEINIGSINSGSTIEIWGKLVNSDTLTYSNTGKGSFSYNKVDSLFDDENTLGSGAYVELKEANEMGDFSSPAYIESGAYGYYPGYEGPLKTSFYYLGVNEISEEKLFVEDMATVNYYKTVKVVFESNGGSEIDDQVFKVGGLAEEPADPIKDEFVFSGWYIDEDLTTTYDFSSLVNEDIILYAKWIEAETESDGSDTVDNGDKDKAEKLPDTGGFLALGIAGISICLGSVLIKKGRK